MIKKRPNITPPPYLITGITQEVGFTGTPGEVRNGIFNGNSKEESAEERKVPVVH